MTNEEMQKTINFIVEQQAQSSTKIDVLVEAQMRTDEGIRALLSIAEIHERETRAKKTERKMFAPEGKSRPLRKTPADRRLKALAELVERQISARRNRKP